MAKQEYFYALGRRKSATARVRLMGGKGTTTVNGKFVEEYFNKSELLLKEINKPFELLDKVNKFDVSVVVEGSGPNGQASAIQLGISKSLVLVNEDFKSTLKKANLLTRDSRERERKKFGLKGARKQRQFTKR